MKPLLFISFKMLRQQRLKFIMSCLNLLIGCILLTVFFSVCVNLTEVDKQYTADNSYFLQIPVVINNARDKKATFDQLTSRRGLKEFRTTYSINASSFVKVEGLLKNYLAETTFYGGNLFLETDNAMIDGEKFLAGRDCEKVGEAVLRCYILELMAVPTTPEELIGRKVEVRTPQIVNGVQTFVTEEYTVCGVLSSEACFILPYGNIILKYYDEPVYKDNVDSLTMQFRTKSQAADVFAYVKEQGLYANWPFNELYLQGRAIEITIVALALFGVALALLVFLNLQNTLNSMIDEKSMSYALFKSFGFSAHHNNFIVYSQSALMMLVSALVSLPLTFGVTKLIARAIQMSMFGISSSAMFAWSVWGYLVAIAVSLVISVIYAIAPANAVKRISLLQALKAC